MTRHLQSGLIIALATCVLAVGVSGCQSVSSKLVDANPIKSWNETPPQIEVPERVVGAWTEAVLHHNGKGTRGFGGRLYFYGRGSGEPVRVDGRLVVYAFAEDGRSPTDNRPTKRYVFPPEQFAKHESDSEIGVSYSVWLPWDTVGGEQAEVSLIARFEPSQGGGLVVSDQTRHRLPGKPRQDTMIADKTPAPTVTRTSLSTNPGPATTQALYQENVEENRPTLKATTISLPGRFKNADQSQPVPASDPGDKAVSSVPTATSADLQPTPAQTTVKYLTPGESVRRSLRPRSSGSSH